VDKDGTLPGFEHLILFDEKTLSQGQKTDAYSPEDDLDLAWVMQYVSDVNYFSRLATIKIPGYHYLRR
jgi:hypothetical protein